MSNTLGKSKKAKPARTVKKVITPKQEETSVQLKAETPKVRYLKLKPFYRQSTSNHSPSKIVPELRLCGNWLQDAGFLPNNYVNVTVMDGLLLIRSAQEQSS
ncbi:SymE family type I addiction module toxin [Culturomica massiliensis]|uniref:SymE family type I addiction module toxin n=1 Tax=Culturomica massiliensis TaxID=1841857 RepID=UPI003463ECC0